MSFDFKKYDGANELLKTFVDRILRTWKIEDVFMVHESLTRAHESINKLALVPESF